MCTNCAYGNSTVPAICHCENPSYGVKVGYGQNCGLGLECAEGFCFRPCETFLHMTSCPNGPGDHCQWDSETKLCKDRPAAVRDDDSMWVRSQDGKARPAEQEAGDIVDDTDSAVFPMAFDYFRMSALGYRVLGVLIDDLTSFRSIFFELDSNVDGYLQQNEYAKLPEVFGKLEVQARNASLTQRRRLQEHSAPEVAITPEVCNAKRPRQFYCSFDVSCKTDCRECGWKTATSRAFSACVRPSPEACFADAEKIFCESDQLCHEQGDCSNCADRPIVDFIQRKCIQLWWAERPLVQMKDWVCRDRNKVGMPCRADMDCVYGMKRCLLGVCQPFQPYNPNQTCVEDVDCPHLGFYCPRDPTGGSNRYWVQYCREQGSELMTCKADRECNPDMRCNTAESPHRCRRLFSLPIGAPSRLDELCSYGWRDMSWKCAPPAKSRRLGRSCDSAEDCSTTDMSGRTGECVCKSWWEKGDPKYCEPVSGDYTGHQEKLRNYLDFMSKKCGTFWSEHECLRVFGSQALKLKLEYECEKQKLVHGPFLPRADCEIIDQDRFPDSCDRLQKLG